MLIRPRVDADLDPLLCVLAVVHESDGYPVRAASVSRAFLAPSSSLGEWVAEVDRAPVGQVARLAGVESSVLAEATGRPAAQLAGVGGLFVAPWARGGGVTRALLDTACAAARRLGRVPVLDVVDGSPASAP